MTKKRIVLWSLGGLLGLILMVVIAGLLFLRTQNFRSFVTREIIRQADEATGGRTEIGNFSLNLSGLHADLYAVRVHGTEADTTRPLLLVVHIGVTIKILSLLQRK